MANYTEILQGLVDGTRPLPPPHPQRLMFPNDADLIRELGQETEKLVAYARVKLSSTEAQHLLFKLAVWCRQRLADDVFALRGEIDEIASSVSGELITNPRWLTSKAGVGQVIGYGKRFQQVRRKKARRGTIEPDRICDVGGTSEFYLVELQNGRQVFEEGCAIGHSMKWEFDWDVLDQREAEGEPHDKFECLSYAVKIRSGEVRLFSLRAVGWEPLMSIGYSPQTQEVVHLEGKKAWFGEAWCWTPMRCDVVYALSQVVPVRSVYWEPTCCDECERRPWCQRAIEGSHPLGSTRQADVERDRCRRRDERLGAVRFMPNHLDILQGLVDGTHPLPRPHPQRLSFPKDPLAIQAVVATTLMLLSRNLLDLDEGELRHLLFKLASWCQRRGGLSEEAIQKELIEVWPDVELTLMVSRRWLVSRAGVGWTIRRAKQLRCEMDVAARASFEEPPRVGDVNQNGYYLVELTNAGHIYREGVAMGHCMSWSINAEVVQKRGYAADVVMNALTYVLKVRSGELRLFSVRGPDGEPVLTVGYEPKAKRIVNVVGKNDRDACHYPGVVDEAIKAVACVVPVDYFAR